MVVATCHFHVFQRLQAWVVDKLQHAPSFVSNKRPTHIVPPVALAPPQVAQPTARHIWNHMRGVLSIPPRSKPRFTDTAPRAEELWWQLTQAVTTAERTWVLEAMAQHRHVAPPRQRPREPSPPPAQTPASTPRFVAWPLELGLGTHNPRFIAWPLELGLGTHKPRFNLPVLLRKPGQSLLRFCFALCWVVFRCVVREMRACAL